MPATHSSEIRARLNHPVIDCDGHLVPFPAPLEDYVRSVGGGNWGVRFSQNLFRRTRSPQAEELIKSGHVARSAWWFVPTKSTLDRATVSLPKLLHKRLDDMGIDYTILFSSATGVEIYRTNSSASPPSFDTEAQRIWCRALNTYQSDITREYSDRMTAAAYIPMNTPQEAIEDVEYAVETLKMKAITISSELRPIAALETRYPDFFRSHQADHDPLTKLSTAGLWLDTFGVDSAYDFDPFWAKCVELKLPVMSHGSGQRFTSRSTSNYMYNHMGNFADAGEAICKSLFLGGVTRRFPTLKFAFLEGGVAWACRLYCDILAHWSKRNRQAMQNYNPANLDRALFLDLHKQYGGKMVEGGKLDKVLTVSPGANPEPIGDPALLDEFSACNINRPEDIRDLFVPNFYFGCEADDPMNANAFNKKMLPMGVQLKAVMSSDIGHWDVPDMTKVLAETHELVEHGLFTQDDFKKFTFTHAVDMLTGSNPDFFKNTVIEKHLTKSSR